MANVDSGDSSRIYNGNNKNRAISSSSLSSLTDANKHNTHQSSAHHLSAEKLERHTHEMLQQQLLALQPGSEEERKRRVNLVASMQQQQFNVRRPTTGAAPMLKHPTSFRVVTKNTQNVKYRYQRNVNPLSAVRTQQYKNNNLQPTSSLLRGKNEVAVLAQEEDDEQALLVGRVSNWLKESVVVEEEVKVQDAEEKKRQQKVKADDVDEEGKLLSQKANSPLHKELTENTEEEKDSPKEDAEAAVISEEELLKELQRLREEIYKRESILQDASEEVHPKTLEKGKSAEDKDSSRAEEGKSPTSSHASTISLREKKYQVKNTEDEEPGNVFQAASERRKAEEDERKKLVVFQNGLMSGSVIQAVSADGIQQVLRDIEGSSIEQQVPNIAEQQGGANINLSNMTKKRPSTSGANKNLSEEETPRKDTKKLDDEKHETAPISRWLEKHRVHPKRHTEQEKEAPQDASTFIVERKKRTKTAENRKKRNLPRPATGKIGVGGKGIFVLSGTPESPTKVVDGQPPTYSFAQATTTAEAQQMIFEQALLEHQRASSLSSKPGISSKGTIENSKSSFSSMFLSRKQQLLAALEHIQERRIIAAFEASVVKPYHDRLKQEKMLLTESKTPPPEPAKEEAPQQTSSSQHEKLLSDESNVTESKPPAPVDPERTQRKVLRKQEKKQQILTHLKEKVLPFLWTTFDDVRRNYYHRSSDIDVAESFEVWINEKVVQGCHKYRIPIPPRLLDPYQAEDRLMICPVAVTLATSDSTGPQTQQLSPVRLRSPALPATITLDLDTIIYVISNNALTLLSDTTTKNLDLTVIRSIQRLDCPIVPNSSSTSGGPSSQRKASSVTKINAPQAAVMKKALRHTMDKVRRGEMENWRMDTIKELKTKEAVDPEVAHFVSQWLSTVNQDCQELSSSSEDSDGGNSSSSSNSSEIVEGGDLTTMSESKNKKQKEKRRLKKATKEEVAEAAVEGPVFVLHEWRTVLSKKDDDLKSKFEEKILILLSHAVTINNSRSEILQRQELLTECLHLCQRAKNKIELNPERPDEDGRFCANMVTLVTEELHQVNSDVQKFSDMLAETKAVIQKLLSELTTLNVRIFCHAMEVQQAQRNDLCREKLRLQVAFTMLKGLIRGDLHLRGPFEPLFQKLCIFTKSDSLLTLVRNARMMVEGYLKRLNKISAQVHQLEMGMAESVVLTIPSVEAEMMMLSSSSHHEEIEEEEEEDGEKKQRDIHQRAAELLLSCCSENVMKRPVLNSSHRSPTQQQADQSYLLPFEQLGKVKLLPGEESSEEENVESRDGSVEKREEEVNTKNQQDIRPYRPASPHRSLSFSNKQRSFSASASFRIKRQAPGGGAKLSEESPKPPKKEKKRIIVKKYPQLDEVDDDDGQCTSDPEKTQTKRRGGKSGFFFKMFEEASTQQWRHRKLTENVHELEVLRLSTLVQDLLSGKTKIEMKNSKSKNDSSNPKSAAEEGQQQSDKKEEKDEVVADDGEKEKQPAENSNTIQEKKRRRRSSPGTNEKGEEGEKPFAVQEEKKEEESLSVEGEGAVTVNSSVFVAVPKNCEMHPVLVDWCREYPLQLRKSLMLLRQPELLGITEEVDSTDVIEGYSSRDGDRRKANKKNDDLFTNSGEFLSNLLSAITLYQHHQLLHEKKVADVSASDGGPSPHKQQMLSPTNSRLESSLNMSATPPAKMKGNKKSPHPHLPLSSQSPQQQFLTPTKPKDGPNSASPSSIVREMEENNKKISALQTKEAEENGEQKLSLSMNTMMMSSGQQGNGDGCLVALQDKDASAVVQKHEPPTLILRPYVNLTSWYMDSQQRWKGGVKRRSHQQSENRSFNQNELDMSIAEEKEEETKLNIFRRNFVRPQSSSLGLGSFSRRWSPSSRGKLKVEQEEEREREGMRGNDDDDDDDVLKNFPSFGEIALEAATTKQINTRSAWKTERTHGVRLLEPWWHRGNK